MDYKEEYQKALERAKKGLPIDEVFPELKENEDERIRKEMLNSLKEAEDSIVLTPFKKKSWITYLEKQKEQKTNPYSGTGFDYNGHHWGMCARDGGVEIIVDEKIRDRVSFESENIKWSNSDAKEMFIKALERAVEQTKNGYELTDCDKHSWWEDFKAYSEINPAEWSEEDEKMKNNLIGLLIRLSANTRTDSTSINYSYPREISWLKSLHPHWKPSEEQMDALEYFIRSWGESGTMSPQNPTLCAAKTLLNDLKKL